MKKNYYAFKWYYFIFLWLSITTFLRSQTVLQADGPGNTYELITAVLAPGYDPIESPGVQVNSCDNHSEFGRHISEVFDNELDQYVFQFDIHVDEDNDRCRNFDRQRNEIKTYNQSPDNLLGVEDETVEYKWMFKLPEGFQSSSSFTHIHQLKAVGGSEDSMPLITLTTRKSSPDRLELRYAEALTQVTLTTAPLSTMLGTWVEVIEKVTYGESGSYEIQLRNHEDDSMILEYEDDDIRMWKTDAEFIRPKWGIYRSLNSASDLRDEQVLFSDFSIEELTTLSIESFNSESFEVYPNPVESELTITFPNQNADKEISVYSIEGKLVHSILMNPSQSVLDLTSLNTGIYILNIKDLSTHELLIQQIVKE